MLGAEVSRMNWFFEPGHSAAEFRAQHMMVTWVRGSFKNVRGRLEFDPAHPERLAVERPSTRGPAGPVNLPATSTFAAGTSWTANGTRDSLS